MSFRLVQSLTRSLSVVLLLLVGAATVLAAATDTTVPVRGGEHSGFGRLVFDWPAEIEYQAELVGDELVVSFPAGARFDLSALSGDMEDYLGPVRVADDGMSIRFSLKASFGLTHFRMGPKIVIDLMAQPGQEATAEAAPVAAQPAAAVPEAPAEPAPPASAAAARVPVRVGEHPGFSRLVFDWSEAVGFRVEEVPGRITIHFDRPAQFDLSRFRSDPPPAVSAMVPRAAAEGVVVDLAVPTGASLRHYRDNGHLVFDVVEPGGAGARQRLAEAATDSRPAATGAPTPLLPAARAERDTNQPAPASVPLPQARPDRTAGRSDTAAEGRATASAAVPADDQTLAPSAGADAQPDSGSASAGTAAHGAETPNDEPDDLVSANGIMSTTIAVDTPVPGRDAVQARPVALRFNWVEPVAAAAFRRGGRLWLVFDRPVQSNIARRIAKVAPALEPIDQLRHAEATIVRLSAPPEFLPELRPDGNDWVVDLRPRIGEWAQRRSSPIRHLRANGTPSFGSGPWPR